MFRSSSYDAVLACIPDEPKINVLAYLLGNGKHVLVEKPLWAGDEDSIARLEAVARSKGVVCYVAYNHRFEPHFVRMREAVSSGKLGALYHCRMFYGNGTARLVREFAMARPGRWRAPRPRLASARHRAILVWRHRREYPGRIQPLLRESCARSCRARRGSATPQLELEMTLLNWRNHFTCDLFAENGSAHIRSLCKWGPSSFTLRRRVLPSGRPPEDTITLVQDDPTWELEYAHFKSLCAGGHRTDLSRDIQLNRVLRQLGQAAVAEARR